MPDKLIFAWRDYDNDRQQVSFDQLEASDLNANFNAMKAEFDKWLSGGDGGGGAFEELALDSGQGASSPIAQSASQAIVEYRDTTTNAPYTKRLPFPDFSKADDAQAPPQPAFIPAGGVTVFNPLHTDYAPLVAAIEAATISPNGNGIAVSRIYIEE